MRFECLYYKGKRITSVTNINNILSSNGFYWLLDCEFENAEIELCNNTIIWKSGTLYSGRWYYGIWENGIFHGIWENGIWVGGDMKGKFLSGIK